MNNQIKTYYIPTNPNIKTGTIYTLYINNNTNLDLTSILTETTNQNINLITPSKVTISINEYNKLLNLNKQIQTTINKINLNLENFIKQEKDNVKDLIQLNIEYNNSLKAIPTTRSDKNG